MKILRGFDLCRAAMAVTGISAPEQSVLLTLAVMANDDAQCWPGINGVSGLTGKTKLSERTVQRAVMGLKEAGHINYVDKPGRGRVYIVHPRQSGTSQEDTPVTLTPRQNDTPVTVTPTPVTVAPKQPRTTNPQRATPSSERAKVVRVRMPDDWKPVRFADDTVAREIIDRRGIEWARAALESFRNWAANADDRTGRKVDWQRAWANWIIEQDKRDGGRSTARVAGGGRGGSSSGRGSTIDAAQRVLSRRALSAELH